MIRTLSRRPGRCRPASPRRHAGAVGVTSAAVLLAVAAVFGWFGGGPLAAAGPVSPGTGTDVVNVAQRSYVVEPGDTLWSIARHVQPDGDVRPLVDRLGDARGAGPLQPGEVLLLP
ncbi:MAG: LysM peptidoglycan-binding domain-containing protein [Acidimicrobiales bacterium]